jgi:hypothetical protein
MGIRHIKQIVAVAVFLSPFVVLLAGGGTPLIQTLGSGYGPEVAFVTLGAAVAVVYAVLLTRLVVRMR